MIEVFLRALIQLIGSILQVRDQLRMDRAISEEKLRATAAEYLKKADEEKMRKSQP